MSGWLFGGWPPPAPGAGGAVDIGDLVGGGTPNSVLFIDAAGKLAQDPGAFSYDKVKHQLQRQKSSSFAIETVPATEFTYGVAWNKIVAEFPFPNAIFDPVMRIGFNLAPGGGPQVAGKAALGLEMEGNAPRNDDPTKAATELHLIAIDELGTETRFLTAFNNHDGTKLDMQITADVLHLVNRALASDFLTMQTVSGAGLVKVPSPARLQVEAVGGIVSPLTFSDGAPTDPAGIVTQAGAQIIQLGINDSSIGPQTNARKGGFVRWASHPAFPMLSIFGRDAGAVAATQLATYNDNGQIGTLKLFKQVGQVNALLNLSDAATLPNVQLAKTAIVPVGAVVQFKVQDETGAVFYIAAQAA